MSSEVVEEGDEINYIIGCSYGAYGPYGDEAIKDDDIAWFKRLRLMTESHARRC